MTIKIFYMVAAVKQVKSTRRAFSLRSEAKAYISSQGNQDYNNRLLKQNELLRKYAVEEKKHRRV